jgi:peptidoglycan glycosyltransferase
VKQAELAHKIKELAFVALIAFCAMPFYIGYWAVFRAPDLKGNPLNKRAQARAVHTEPGRLMASGGEEILGRVPVGKGLWESTYTSPLTYCHLTGYDRQTGLQLSLRSLLLEPAGEHDLLAFLESPEPVGSDVELTIVDGAQALARERLEGQRGAVVALDPKTGAVLVLASAPTFQPAEVAKTHESWELFSTDPASPGLNRAVQGLYPLGSIFKVVTAAASLESGTVSVDTEYTCSGEIAIGDRQLRCWKAGGHGTLNLADALAQSCNVYFAQLGEDLGIGTLSSYAQRTGLFDAPPLPLPANTVAASRLATTQTGDLASASYALGQGDLLVTPFAAAQMAAAVANGGVLMRPELIKAVMSPRGQVRQSMTPTAERQAFRESTARLVAGMMESAVESGTGRAAQLPTVRVAGKTGSAQAPGGEAHAWFIGFAPAQDPTVAVAVVIEHGGSGGAAAAPIARDIIETLLR